MPWNSTAPVGSISVKANRIILQQNTTYIEDTMGNSVVGTNTVTTRDHFWDVGADEDGRHRFIQSPGFTVGGNPDDPVLGTGMDSVLYPKLTSDRVEWFHRNAEGIYQFLPSYLTGAHAVTGSFTNMVTVPQNVYGEIYMTSPTIVSRGAQVGFFWSDNATCMAWPYAVRNQADGSSPVFSLIFGNGTDASGLNIRVRTGQGVAGNWNYRITYRTM